MDIVEADLPKVAQKIVTKLQSGDILLLSGPLAVGKTTLTRAITQELGYTGPVTSPTFVLEKHYKLETRDKKLETRKFKEIVHLDFYRLTPDQLKSFDWQDYLTDPSRITIIEWPEIALAHIPPEAKQIKLEIIDDKKRRLTFSDNFGY
jgi:tRNA threonylcarbamoyladenosine biosynthesis protein TsaE